jgi:hypothetical protein
MGLSQSSPKVKEGLILETAAGETYFYSGPTKPTIEVLCDSDALVALQEAEHLDEFQSRVALDSVNTLARSKNRYYPLNTAAMPDTRSGVYNITSGTPKDVKGMTSVILKFGQGTGTTSVFTGIGVGSSTATKTAIGTGTGTGTGTGPTSLWGREKVDQTCRDVDPTQTTTSTIPAVPGLRTSIRIVWMTPSAEAGMPHTRAPDLVCLPAYYPTESLAKTILHESIHIDQRKNPMKWVRWCISQGWTIVRDQDIPERWKRRCRLNPDTMAYRFWAYQNRWVPLPLFEREDKPQLRQVQVKWWDRQTGMLLENPPTALASFLHGVGNPEHPFEIAAYKEIQI